MHILFEKVWAFVAAMSIEYSKVAAARPSSFKVGLCYIHNDGYSIFVVIFDESMKGIDSISFDGAIGSLYELDWLHLGYIVTLFLFVLIHHLYF